MNYHVFREFADSWALLALVVFFVGVFVWAFRPGSKATHADTASIPFRHEDRPAPDSPAAPRGKEIRT
jgi:cytochrome c oxidase cbb3-type subunit 4